MTMDDYFIHLLKLASCISRRLVSFIEELLFGHVERVSYDSELPSSGWHDKSSSTECESSHGDDSMECGKRLINPTRDLSRHECFGVFRVRWMQSFNFQGLTSSLFGVRLGYRLASSCFRNFWLYIKTTKIGVSGFLSRVWKTLQGSSEDIGWLQRTEGFPSVEDGTTRFMELLHDIRNGKHCLPNTLVYLLIPGLFSNHCPLYFVNTRRFFSKMGLTSHIAKIHSEASVERNAWELKLYIEELYWGSGKKVLLLGHSKGGVDAAAALSLYWNDLKDKVAGLALVQSPYGGTPIASDMLREGQIAHKEARKIMEFIVCKIIKGDMRALDDLTYEKRKDFITKHRLPSEQIPLLSFHTEASIAPGVLATMSLIAHAEIPWIPLPSFFFPEGKEMEESWKQGGRKVPVVLPVAAAMAVYALHLKLRYGESSDGMVTRRDAEVPGSVVVRPDRKLDHAWMVYSKKDNNNINVDGANSSEMCEALLTMLVEIGRRKIKV